MRRYLLIILCFIQFVLSAQYDLAHDQNGLMSSDFSQNWYVAELRVNPNWDTITSISYQEVSDPSNRFAITGAYVYLTNATGLTASTTYTYQFRVVDGTIADTATLSVYCADADSVYYDDIGGGGGDADEIIDWDNNFTAGYYYLFARGQSDSCNQEITFNAANITIGAYGAGARPILINSWGDGVQDYNDYSFNCFGHDNFTIRDVHLRTYDSDYGLHIRESTGAIVDNVYVEGPHEHIGTSIFLENCDNHKVVNCIVLNPGDDAIWGKDCQNHEVAYNISHNTGYYNNEGDNYQTAEKNDGLYLHHNWFRRTVGDKQNILIETDTVDANAAVRIEYNYLENTPYDHATWTAHTNILIKDGYESVRIIGNKLTGGDDCTIKSSIDGDIDTLIIDNNIFYRTANRSIGLEESYSAVYIRNNTVYDWEGDFIYWEGFGDPIWVMKNNIFHKGSASTQILDGNGNNLTNEDIDYNCYWPNTTDIFKSGEGWAVGANAIVALPNYNDTTIYDLDYSPTSANIDAGTNLLSTDYYGLARPYNSTSDIGHMEYTVFTTPSGESGEYYIRKNEQNYYIRKNGKNYKIKIYR